MVRESKPTPVRDALREGAAEPEEIAFPKRSFQWEGEEWWAEELGRARAGRREDPGPVLVLVGFRRDSHPEGGFSRETMVRGSGLAELSELELEELFRNAGPFRAVSKAPSPFFGPRGSEQQESPGRRGKGPRGGGRR